jgi:hypothetical protein
MDKDLEHLKLLSIFYYINAGITALFSCFPIIHVSIGVAIVLGSLNGGPNPPPAFIGWIFIAIGSVIILGGWTLAFLSFLTAKYLKQHKNYMFCNIIAGINCAFFPTGTILGVFTFLVLLREPVKQLFKGITPREFQPAAMTPPDWR